MKGKAPRQAHTSNSKFGMGDFYGTALRTKIGRARDISLVTTPKLGKGNRNPPRKLG
jgi:hypothetical protein